MRSSNRRKAGGIEPDRAPRLARAGWCIVAGIVACAPGARACGPDFPRELLADRAGTLGDLPEGSFSFEVRRLVPRPDARLVPLEVVADREAHAAAAPARLDARMLAAEQAMRAAASVESAARLGAALPEDARSYTIAAVAQRMGDDGRALAGFERVRQLPAEAALSRGAWAAYSAGRQLARDGREDAALAAFREVRTRVLAGADDGDGLAVSSFGEEARLHLDRGRTPESVALYAQQASTGSLSGRNSLLFLARRAYADATLRDALVADPLGRQLLVAYAFTHSAELATEPGDGSAGAAPPAAILQLLEAIEALKLPRVDGADRLAALAYRAGRYELAARYVALDEASALAAWVRAKLALRAGDHAAALAAYAEAARGFPADESWGQSSGDWDSGSEWLQPRCRVDGERATLALARGEYLQAFEWLWSARANYYVDAATLAERVLTLEELKGYVDAHVPPSTRGPARDVERDYTLGSQLGWVPGSDGVYQETDPAFRLRWLLARRLMRADRRDEALAYFDDPTLKALAQAYGEGWRNTRALGRIARARAWFETARIARRNGMELLGFELDPDYTIYGGEYDLNRPGELGLAVDGSDGPPRDPATHLVARSEPAPQPPYAGTGEATRLAQTRARPNARFHYRMTAVDLAMKAAQELPERSQAYAAVLCHATSWIIDREPARAQRIYRTYVEHGPLVPWAAHFGRDCPSPDFKGARERLSTERIRIAKRTALVVLPLVVIVVAGAGFRRKRGSPQHTTPS